MKPTGAAAVAECRRSPPSPYRDENFEFSKDMDFEWFTKRTLGAADLKRAARGHRRPQEPMRKLVT